MLAALHSLRLSCVLTFVFQYECPARIFALHFLVIGAPQKRVLECSKCSKVLKRPSGVAHSVLLQRHVASGCVEGVRKARPNKLSCSAQGCRNSEFVKVRKLTASNGYVPGLMKVGDEVHVSPSTKNMSKSTSYSVWCSMPSNGLRKRQQVRLQLSHVLQCRHQAQSANVEVGQVPRAMVGESQLEGFYHRTVSIPLTVSDDEVNREDPALLRVSVLNIRQP